MTPKGYMILGALFGILFAGIATLMPEEGMAIVPVFASGALFGKGYGIWEERSRPTPTQEREE